MDKINILILDKDSYYINNLLNYISEKYKENINAVSFSKQEFLNSYLDKENVIDAVLCSESFYEDNIQVFKNKIVIFLGDSNKINNNIPILKKYQSAEKLCTYVLNIVDEKRKSKAIKNTKILSFYSPIGGIGNTTIAFATANVLASKGEKVLLLSLEDTQSMNVFMSNDKSQYSLSDLIISIKESSDEFKNIISKGILKYKNIPLFYFNKVESILDIECLSLEDTKEFIEKLKEFGGFDYIIFDLPSCLNSKFFNILDSSLAVFSLIGQDKMSIYKVDSMLKQLDNIHNFKFIYNLYNKAEERLIPKLVISNKLPIIGEIPFYDDISGKIELDKENNMDFFNNINLIIEEIF